MSAKGRRRRRGAWARALIAACAVVAAGSLGQGAERPPVSPRQEVGAPPDYHRWTRVTKGAIQGKGHDGLWVHLYMNPAGEAAFRGQRFPFPPGTVLVKESFESLRGRPAGPGPIFLMRKEPPGYAPEDGDWHWAMYGADRQLIVEGRGDRVRACVLCHQRAASRDYVYTLP